MHAHWRRRAVVPALHGEQRGVDLPPPDSRGRPKAREGHGKFGGRVLGVWMSLLVVLGAGASYDSDKASPVGSGGDSVHQRIQIEARPPLAAQLFEDAQYGHSAYRQAVDRYPRAA